MGKISRIWHQIRFFTISGRIKRMEYLKKKGYFRSVGERVSNSSLKIPLYPELISIGNNVWIASDVTFITHDVIHYMLNGFDKNYKFTEKMGCINIEDNVFIGNGTRIMYGVNIGRNSIIAAGSVITKDVEPYSIVAGVPARKILDFEDFHKKKIEEQVEIQNTILKNHKSGSVTKEEADYLWDEFWKKRDKIRP